MNIYIVTSENSSFGGGLAYSCLAFERMLRGLGHEVTMIHSSPAEGIVTAGYDPNLGFALAMEEKLKSDCQNLETGSLIISFGGGMTAYYGALISLKSHCKLWVLFRGSDANLAKWDINKTLYNQYALSVAEKIFCLSEEIAANIRLLQPGLNNIYIIPNYCERENPGIISLPKNNIVMGCGATHLNEKKGIIRILRMMSVLRRIHPEITLTLEVAGNIDDDVLKLYEDIVEADNLSDVVKFLGAMSRSDFKDTQARWQLYIQGSICEGMGNSVTDAMSEGIPVILTNTGFIAEYAKNVFPEMVFSSFEPSVMAEELYRLINMDNVSDRYQELYSDIFQRINEDKVTDLWRVHLLGDYKSHIFEVSPETILSVSLHDVDGEKHDNITTPIDVFKRFADDIHSSGFNLCSMADYLHLSQEQRKNYIVCTFDDGYAGLINNALPIMNFYGFTATVFVCSDYIGKNNDWNYKDKTTRRHLDISELKTLQNNGWEIGSHGVTHQSLLRLNDDDLEYQLSESKRRLQSIFGPISSYAYPYGDISPFIENQVRRYYDSAFLLTQGGVFLEVDRHRIHRYYISEIYQILKSK